MKSKILLGAALSSAMLFSGCGLFAPDEPTSQSKGGILVPNIELADCSETSTTADQEALTAAKKAATSSMTEMGDAMNEGTLGNVSANAPVDAESQYRAILAKNPNDCEAQFGLAMTSLAGIAKDPEIEDAMNSADEQMGNEDVSYQAYLNAKPEEIPVLLYKVSQVTDELDGPTITKIQKVAEEKIIPRLDSSIAYLQNIMKYDNFKYEVVMNEGYDNEQLIQLDKGEVGPALAALKSIKALMIVFVAAELEVAIDEKYTWASDVLWNLERPDFDNLSAEQTAALDHLVGLTKPTSLFTTIKAEWQEKYSAIPALLSSAIDDIQDGLRYGIKEASMPVEDSVQKYDLYSIGNGDHNMTVAEAEDAIVHLERVHKYLEGDVEIAYANGTQKFKVNIPKFFKIYNGFQDFLPYHTVLPYAEWNDTISIDQEWTDSFESAYYNNSSFASEVSKSIQESFFDGAYTVDQISSDMDYDFEINSFVVTNTAYMNDPDYSAILIKTNAGKCEFTMTLGDVVKTATITNCRVSSNGRVEYKDWADVVYKVPFMFTDAKGNATFGEDIEAEMEQIFKAEDFSVLATKIIFPDPTFGGVFPGQTNESFWKHINGIAKIKNRTLTCKNPKDPEIEYGYCSQGYALPSNPSDLDILNYYFD